MTLTPVGENGVRDFTLRREPYRFRIDDDVFVAPPIMSPRNLTKLANLHSQIGDTTDINSAEGFGRVLGLVADMFRALLPGPSGERFVERLESDTEPIDLTGQALPIVFWLLEQYGLRPTVPSSVSSTGSTEDATDTPSDGDSSTDGAWPTETGTT
jgi:hypothetical protein